MSDKTNELIELVCSYQPECRDKLQKSCDLAKEYHKGQFRASGEEYYTHPIEVALILANMKQDCNTVITGVLHDTVEDTKLTLNELSKHFDNEVVELVDGVTKLKKIHHKSETQRQAENFRKLLLAVSKNLKVLIVKLADRLHNMRTLGFIKSEDKRKSKALETMEIYAPLAERIGMQEIKNELQDLSFSHLYEDARNSIINRIKLLKKNDEQLVDKIIRVINSLLDDRGLDADVHGREKTPFSIWDKMKRKDISFEQLSDIMAFRIIVKDIESCYQALGIIHSEYHAIPGSFKDYISTPKKNGYQSLHTVIFGPENQKIEIQIRTEYMHLVAQFGLASHWSRKQGVKLDNSKKREVKEYTFASLKSSSNLSDKYNLIKDLLSLYEESSSPEEQLENFKLEIYDDQVFCFTPKGTVIALPKNATAIDFAYAVHSDVGNKCVGAKINGNIIPLRTKLENGDQVEIITNESHNPLPSWEKFAVTAKALSEIRKYVRKQEKQEHINLGRLIMAQILGQSNLDVSSDSLKEVAVHYNKKSNEDFLYAVGNGTISHEQLLKDISNINKTYKTNFKEKPLQLPISNPSNQNTNSISIKGLSDGMAVHLASCCHPIPGDPIVGITQKGKGITVHISDCETLQTYSDAPEKWLDLAWDKSDHKSVYIGTINAVLLHQPGSLLVLTREIEKYKSNISNFRINNRSQEFFEITVDLEIRGKNHLTNIIAALKSQQCIHSVTRHTKL